MKTFFRLKSIKQKIFSVVFSGIFLILLTIGIGFNSLNNLLNDYLYWVKNDVNNEVVIGYIHSDFKSGVQEWKNILLRGNNPNDLKTYTNNLKKYRNKVYKNIDTLLNSRDLSPEFRTNLVLLKTQFKQLEDNYKKAYQEFIDTDFNSHLIDQKYRGIDRTTTNLIENLKTKLRNDTRGKGQEIGDRARQLIVNIPLIIFIVTLLLMAFIYYLLNKKVVFPIRNLIENVDKLSSSNFHFTNDYFQHDEIGKLGRSTQVLKEKMMDSVSQVSIVGYQVDNAYEQLKQVSERIADGADVNANSVEKLQESVSHLTNTTNSLTINAEKSAQSNSKVQNITQVCIQALDENNQGMSKLVTTVNETTQTIEILQQESTNINEILAVINNVAEQTNLLALNAAIEAARAGEAGRGFAVVAEEVRNLAGKTQESTEMIHNVITSLQEASSNAVNAMNTGQTLTEANAQKALELMDYLKQIFTELEQMQAASAEVVDVSEQQKIITEALTKVVNEIIDFSHEYTDIANDTAVSTGIKNAAEELQKLSQGLTENTPEDDELF